MYSYLDLILLPIYLSVIFIIARNIQRKNIRKKPEYKYFTKGLFIKIFGVLLFASAYIFIYGNGDTISYFRGTNSMVKLLMQDFEKGIAVIFDLHVHYNQYSIFNSDSGYPPLYMWRDKETFLVSRLTTIFCFLSFGSFYITSILTCCYTYIGVWKLYLLFNENFPNRKKIFFYSILCIPSLVFWGSGIMKDSYVLGALCWVSYNFYRIFIRQKKVLWNILLLVFNFWILINIKSYVAVSLIPGMLIWLYSSFSKKIKSRVLKVFLKPVLLMIVVFAFLSISNNLSLIGLGKYSNIDETINSAIVIQQDLLREEQYGNNSYYIGEIDGTFTGLLSIAPQAIMTAIFRPFIWESNNVLMTFSALENLILIIVILILIAKTSPFTFINYILKEPLLAYSMTFIILFSFGVGIASTNFGALVRYKIPLIPFFYSTLFLIYKNKNLNRMR